MINLSNLGQVYIACGKTDMRRGIDRFATIIKNKFDLDHFLGKIFILFFSRRCIKAITYALNYEDTFKNVFLDDKLVLSNNHAERAIKTLVIGRKN